MNERYVLATGEEGEYRLRVVNGAHGPDTETFLGLAGLKAGMRVADVGCGVGMVSCRIAEQVGADGEVVGVDVSAEQLRQAEKNAERAGLRNTRFVNASAYETGLEGGSFDLVFSRFMLMHIRRPAEAIAEMVRLLKPDGILAIEDGDFTTLFCYPPSAGFDRWSELYRALGAMHGEDFRIGPKLYGMARAAGLRDVQLRVVQPVFVRGDEKRLPEWTLAELAPVLEEAGLASRAEVEALVTEIAALGADEDVMIAMARMTQVWGCKQ